MRKFDLQTPIKVRYRAHPLFPKDLWPIVDVKLIHKEFSIPQSIFALIDSGANKSLVHLQVAELLGFDVKKRGKPERGVSVSGTYESWGIKDPIRVNIYGFEFSLNFIVVNNPQLIWPCILGEDSIFQLARLDFQKFKGFFEIRFRADIH